MKRYDVTITETLQMTVPIEAESLAEAEQIAEKTGMTASIFWTQIILWEPILRRKSMSGIKI
ncbi:MAG: DpnD/PcfM family protein [Lachnospiraceae bacterium]|nr:DpnD/PcfM family protein [Lachnospiraceae bacterium]MDE7202218.1 DpnD/PcfM family protein [Lachnospiraceae bacterium]